MHSCAYVYTMRTCWCLLVNDGILRLSDIKYIPLRHGDATCEWEGEDLEQRECSEILRKGNRCPKFYDWIHGEPQKFDRCAAE